MKKTVLIVVDMEQVLVGTVGTMLASSIFIDEPDEPIRLENMAWFPRDETPFSLNRLSLDKPMPNFMRGDPIKNMIQLYKERLDQKTFIQEEKPFVKISHNTFYIKTEAEL